MKRINMAQIFEHFESQGIDAKKGFFAEDSRFASDRGTGGSIDLMFESPSLIPCQLDIQQGEVNPVPIIQEIKESLSELVVTVSHAESNFSHIPDSHLRLIPKFLFIQDFGNDETKPPFCCMEIHGEWEEM